MSQMPTADDLIQPPQAPAADTECCEDEPEPDADAHLLNLLVKRHGARNIVVALDSLTYGAGAMGYAQAPELPDPPVMIDNAAQRIVVNSAIPMTMEQNDALRALATTELHYVWQRAYQAGVQDGTPPEPDEPEPVRLAVAPDERIRQVGVIQAAQSEEAAGIRYVITAIRYYTEQLKWDPGMSQLVWELEQALAVIRDHDAHTANQHSDQPAARAGTV